MTPQNDIVFLFDCDNTLLDNARVRDNLRSHLEHEFGVAARDLYWEIFEALRVERELTRDCGRDHLQKIQEQAQTIVNDASVR